MPKQLRTRPVTAAQEELQANRRIASLGVGLLASAAGMGVATIA